MRSLTLVLPFIALTFLSWGVYGPTLHAGQFSFESGAAPSSLKPFICVGISYFLIAVLFPFVLLRTKGEKGTWSRTGVIWSLSAGAVGAIGALGIILAFKFKGQPVYVMPLVFGCAPVVNTFVTMIMGRRLADASFIFYLGVLIVAIGAAGVMTFKPTKKKETTVQFSQEDDQIKVNSTDIGDLKFSSEDDMRGHSEDLWKQYQIYKNKKASAADLVFVGLCIGLTALCWGAYGPVLHKGQAKMEGSRLRPFACVGLAYFVIAVLAPIPMLFIEATADPPGWNFGTGSIWSLIAGAVGAIGALGIIYAFNFGGKPIFVMPLVFGLAPVINTFTTIVTENLYGQVTTMFYVSLLLVIAGAVTVLMFAPKPGPPPKPNSEVEPKPA